MSSRRVVITGAHIVSALGLEADDSFRGLCEGGKGAGPIRFFDPTAVNTTIAYELPGDLDKTFRRYYSRRMLRQTLKYTRAGLIAARQLVERYPVDFASLDRERIGVCCGISGLGLYGATNDTWSVVRMMSNALPAFLTIEWDLHGLSQTIGQGETSGMEALFTAYRLIRDGRADLMIAGGFEAACLEHVVTAFEKAGALSADNAHPDEACRPFDQARSGIVLGEGGAMLILESAEHAAARGARPLCALEGFSVGFQGRQALAPLTEDPIVESIQGALEAGGIPAEGIDLVVAQGNALPEGDRIEARAIARVFGAHRPYVTATKAAFGYCHAGGSAIDVAVAAHSLSKGIVPPLVNLTAPDPDLPALNFVAERAIEAELRAAVVESYAIGGHHASVVMSSVA